MLRFMSVHLNTRNVLRNVRRLLEPVMSLNQFMQILGGMMFLMCAAVNGDIRPLIAAPGGWGGNHATKNVLDRFAGDENMDDRCDVLYTGFNQLVMTDPDEYKQGVQV